MIKNISLILSLIVFSHANTLIGNLQILYKPYDKIDFLYIKSPKVHKTIKQKSLWINSNVEINLLTANEKELQIKLSYIGNRELGYIYTFRRNNTSFELSKINLYQLENGQLCKMLFPKKAASIVEPIETDRCIKLTKFISSLDDLEYVAKYYKLKNILTYNEINSILKFNPLALKTLTKYNNIAYYLQKAGANKEAVFLLEKIVKKFPNRTVAYYNLGDAYWALGEKDKAIKAYTTYMEQMCNKGLQKKIPKEVLERVKVK